MAANQYSGPHKGKSAANALITTVAVVASLVLLNAVAARYPKRADLTEDKIYSLSAYSKKIMADLPDRLNVKLFASGDLPPEFKPVSTYVRDLLDEYRAASGGKIDWESIDPTAGSDDDKKKHQEDLQKYKIQKITLERISENKLEIGAENYLGIAFAYGDQVESIPQVVRTEGLEYQITGMVRRMTAAKKKKIGFVTSEGELQPQQGLQYVSHFLGQDYETTAVQLDKPIPDEIDALFIIGPKQPFNDKGKFYLDQFLMKGKNVALFLDGMKVEAPQQPMQMPGMEQPKLGQPNDTNLQDLLEKYGLKVREDLVFDERNVPGPIPIQGQVLPANYPTFVAIAREGLSDDNPLTHSLGALVMPFPSSLELAGDLKDGKGTVKATALARTSMKSWRNAGFFIFNPTQQKLTRPDNPADKGPFVLGYQLEGKFKTAYPNGMPGTDPTISLPENANALKESPDGTRFIIMASSQMLSDENLQFAARIQAAAYFKNLQFASNVADYLIRDDALSALRAKGMSQRPFVGASETRAQVWRWVIEVGLPILLVLLGVVLWLLRSRRRTSARVDSI